MKKIINKRQLKCQTVEMPISKQKMKYINPIRKWQLKRRFNKMRFKIQISVGQLKRKSNSDSGVSADKIVATID